MLTGQCAGNAVRCPEGTCFHAAAWCDGQSHCSDGSDEPASCGRRSWEEQCLFICHWVKRQRSYLNFIAVFSFYSMTVHISLPSGKTCSIDNGSCSHRCYDEARGARCACPAGYELSANGTDCRGLCVKTNTTLTYSGVHLKNYSDELHTSVYLGVVSQFGINKAYVCYLQLFSIWLENVTIQLQEVHFSDLFFLE